MKWRVALTLARGALANPRVALLGALAGVEEAMSWATFEAEQADWLREVDGAESGDASPAHRAVAARAIAQVCAEVRGDAAAVAARRRRAN